MPTPLSASSQIKLHKLVGHYIVTCVLHLQRQTFAQRIHPIIHIGRGNAHNIIRNAFHNFNQRYDETHDDQYKSRICFNLHQNETTHIGTCTAHCYRKSTSIKQTSVLAGKLCMAMHSGILIMRRMNLIFSDVQEERQRMRALIPNYRF